jgi:hypothetical protein
MDRHHFWSRTHANSKPHTYTSRSHHHLRQCGDMFWRPRVDPEQARVCSPEPSLYRFHHHSDYYPHSDFLTIRHIIPQEPQAWGQGRGHPNAPKVSEHPRLYPCDKWRGLSRQRNNPFWRPNKSRAHQIPKGQQHPARCWLLRADHASVYRPRAGQPRFPHNPLTNTPPAQAPPREGPANRPVSVTSSPPTRSSTAPPTNPASRATPPDIRLMV